MALRKAARVDLRPALVALGGGDPAALDPQRARARDRVRDPCPRDPHAPQTSVYASPMPDDADELILKMQHLEAQAREQEKARALQGRMDRLKTKAQQMALESQREIDAAEAALRLAEDKQAKARARLNFALDKMDEAERNDWEAFQAEARAEAHAQLADDPLVNKPPRP